ncbi:type 1 glutamine amidotransferase domain-containing protein [Gilliamella apicola]|uniref:type 1 glutamine amidotransferase domain-containing protein n=1 Tax=Gilliamella apicola TaxID=1196095 RepID=UPI001179C2D9|nr:type 1 glutamine amidotransferase domain-containing protein [Gilliamella apicola]
MECEYSVNKRRREPPIEYKTLRPKNIRTDAQQWLLDDEFYFNKLRNSFSIKDVPNENYDAIFMPGGHGVMWDFKQNKILADLVTNFYDSNKIVAAICHGPAGLLASVSKKNNNPICSGKKVTCFTNEEEEKVGMTEIVPYLVEDELVKQGGLFFKKESRTPNCVVDGNILTGQNPESSYLLASALIDVLSL